MIEHVHEGETRYFSDDRTRCVMAVGFGWACYNVTVTDGVARGVHVGLVADAGTAERWLDGEDVGDALRRLA